MSIKVPTNRFILSSLRAGFYQQLFKGISGFHELGEKLVREIEVAQTFRQNDKVIEIASTLESIPIKEHQLIGQYYKGLRIERMGGNARGIFERIVEESRTYKTKALMSLATNEARKGNFDEELRYIAEASKTTNNPTLIVELSRGTGIVRAKEGDHKQAVKEFERIFPLIKHIKPISYYQYLNSFAVELAEVGRLEEANKICDVLLASPYVFAYPEWRETAEELRLKLYRSRSIISFSQVTPHNVLQLPERSVETQSAERPAKLLYYTDWKNKMVEESDDDTEIGDLEGLSENDLMVKLLYLATHKGVNAKKLRKVILYAQEVFSEPED